MNISHGVSADHLLFIVHIFCKSELGSSFFLKYGAKSPASEEGGQNSAVHIAFLAHIQ